MGYSQSLVLGTTTLRAAPVPISALRAGSRRDE
jgi:hypothetical protein